MADRWPVIWWVRRDLRLADNPALTAAVAEGGPVIPVFLLDEVVEGHGALPQWRLLLGVGKLDATLAATGSRLILRLGRALETLRALVAETGARQVVWSRLVDPDSRARDEAVKAGLRADGVEARSFPGHLLFEPWTVTTRTGDPFRVYTPYWRAVAGRDVGVPLPPPRRLPVPETWPAGQLLQDWRPGVRMNRGAAVVAPYLTIGEDAARDRLARFIAERIDAYGRDRDFPATDGTSGLGENLAVGEISPRTCWHAAVEADRRGAPGAAKFLQELVWREFAHHLAFHTPGITTRNWRPEWDSFPWNEDASRPEVVAWKQSRTGVPFVDAAMRELYVTGSMHNRARMVAASYLCKHLLTHWRIGQAWFADTLRDWDPASNALGWQWVAGSGPDAAPYFRIFNPETQAARFDPEGRYVARWIAEERARPAPQALSYFHAVPRSWRLSPGEPYPEPAVTLDAGRKRALAAYAAREV